VNPTALRLSGALCLFFLCTTVGHAQTAPTTAAARFALLDRNDDGVVSADEYDGKAVFRELDTNQNYRLSLAELQAVLGPDQDGQLSAADRLRVADLNGDGDLSGEEVSRFAEMRFQSLDTNHDEQLDLAEFQSGFRR
jgi:Ca2+-binding EF-hand superfamily protein